MYIIRKLDNRKETLADEGGNTKALLRRSEQRSFSTKKSWYKTSSCGPASPSEDLGEKEKTLLSKSKKRPAPKLNCRLRKEGRIREFSKETGLLVLVRNYESPRPRKRSKRKPTKLSCREHHKCIASISKRQSFFQQTRGGKEFSPGERREE